MEEQRTCQDRRCDLEGRRHRMGDRRRELSRRIEGDRRFCYDRRAVKRDRRAPLQLEIAGE